MLWTLRVSAACIIYVVEYYSDKSSKLKQNTLEHYAHYMCPLHHVITGVKIVVDVVTGKSNGLSDISVLNESWNWKRNCLLVRVELMV